MKYLFEKKSKNYLTTVRSGVRSQNRVALSEHNMGWRGRCEVLSFVSLSGGGGEEKMCLEMILHFIYSNYTSDSLIL